MRLGELTSAEVPAGSVLVLPVGATEQHGPHLPLDTDTIIATAVSEAAARGHPHAVVAPPIAIGASGEHAGFAGTLSIGTSVLAQTVVEIVRTAGAEFARVVVVNGHGGNVDALTAAASTCDKEGRPIRVWHPRAHDGDAHAGATETSVMLAIAPDRVRLDRAEPGNTDPLPEMIAELRSGGMAAVSASGVLGDPTRSDAASGRVLFDRWVSEVDSLLRP